MEMSGPRKLRRNDCHGACWRFQVPQYQKYLWLFLAILTLPSTQTSPAHGLPSPCFSFPYSTDISAMLSLSSSFLGPLSCPSPLVPFACTAFVVLSQSPLPPLLMDQSSLLTMSSPLLLPLLWTLLDASSCALPHVYNKNLLLSHTLQWSCPQFIQKGPR